MGNWEPRSSGQQFPQDSSFSKGQQLLHYTESLNVKSSICMSSAYCSYNYCTYKRLASLLAARRNQDYGSLVSWIRYSTSFSLLRSAVTCLHGVRSHRGSPVTIGALDLAIAEVHPIDFSCVLCPALLHTVLGGDGKGPRKKSM